MYKILLSGIILLLLFVSGLNLSLGSEETKEATPVPGELQVSEQVDGFLSRDLPPIKGFVKSFVIVMGLIAIFFVFLKWRYGFSRVTKGNKKHIQVIEYSMLGPKRYLYLVKVLDKLLVVGATADGLSLLCEMDGIEENELPEKSMSTETGFSGLIKKFSFNKDV